MSRWDQKTEGHSRSRRDGPSSGRDRSSRSRSRSRSNSPPPPVERNIRELEEERRRKERLLKEAMRLHHQNQQRNEENSLSGDSSDGSNSEEVLPPAPVLSKIGFNFQKPKTSTSNPKATPSSLTGFQLQKAKPTAIQMKLATAPKKETPKLLKPTANAFAGDDSDDEPEEMPAECRMRMRNIGRETPTSSGPNSFGKTKHGFCDSKKIFEKKLNSLND